MKGVGTVTPLTIAANNGLTDCYKCLLEAGADPDVRDDVCLNFSYFVLLLCACSSHATQAALLRN